MERWRYGLILCRYIVVYFEGFDEGHGELGTGYILFCNNKTFSVILYTFSSLATFFFKLSCSYFLLLDA